MSIFVKVNYPKLVESLVDTWRARTPNEAHDELGKPDVDVTNKSDKKEGLLKILNLNQEVRIAVAMRDEAERVAKLTLTA